MCEKPNGLCFDVGSNYKLYSLNTIIILPNKNLESFNYRVNINEASQDYFFHVISVTVCL